MRAGDVANVNVSKTTAVTEDWDDWACHVPRRSSFHEKSALFGHIAVQFDH